MLHAQASPRALGLVRIVVFGMWWWHVLLVRSPEMAGMPVGLLEPVGVLALLPGPVWAVLWTAEALWALKVLLLVGLGVSVLGTRWFRPVAVGTCVLLTLYQGMPCSFGFVNHAEAVPLYAAYILAAFPSADGLSLFGPRRPRRPAAVYRAPLVAVTLVFLLTYTLVATRRLCLGGLGIFFDDTILYQVGGGGVVSPVRLGLRALENPWLVLMLRVGYPIITLHELLAPLCLYSRHFRWCWKAVMVPFHIGTGLLMGIFFPMSLLLIAVVLIDIDWFIAVSLSRQFSSDKITRDRACCDGMPSPIKKDPPVPSRSARRWA
jgi:hypothetical protein